MSLDLHVYTGQLSDDLIPKMIRRLNAFDMIADVHPDFSFTNQTGFLPFKIRLMNPSFNILKDKELLSGFELNFEDFDLQTEKKDLQPKQSFLDKLKGKKLDEVPFAPPEIENRLKNCTRVANFNWQLGDSFELRMALMMSAILTEATNGICYNPQEDFWYENKNIVEEAYKDVKQYEQAITENNLRFHEFEQWR